MNPDIRDYDWIMINSSAGKDSQAMLIYLVELADKLGVSRDRLIVAHADLKRAEWDGTRVLAEVQAMYYGLRFITSSNRTHDTLIDYVRHRQKWPDAARRWCTSDFKRGPMQRVLTALATESREAGVDRPIRLLNCMGIRKQESPARSKKIPFQVNKACTGKGTRKQVDD